MSTEKLKTAYSEAQREVNRFTSDAREKLERRGYLIYSLTGQSLKTLRHAEKPFWTNWHSREDFEEISSRLSEVAVDPVNLFLPHSRRKSIEKHEELIAKFSLELQQYVEGVKAV